MKATNRIITSTMKSNHILVAATLVSVLFRSAFGQTATNPPPFSAIYAFGKCLTDTHNEPPLFPNWQGRYSNGPMWIERASTNLGLAYQAPNNFAVSASSTLDVVAQVTAF